jgi:cystathionine gamma-synthase
LALAKFLTEQSLVTTVHYPGLISHPQHDIAARQMKNGFGGVLSIELPSEALAMAFVGALQTAQRATSLGGTETLAEHRASIEPPGRVTSPPGLVRISVGLEDVSDLMDDFTRALTIAEQVAK